MRSQGGKAFYTSDLQVTWQGSHSYIHRNRQVTYILFTLLHGNQTQTSLDVSSQIISWLLQDQDLLSVRETQLQQRARAGLCLSSHTFHFWQQECYQWWQWNEWEGFIKLPVWARFKAATPRHRLWQDLDWPEFSACRGDWWERTRDNSLQPIPHVWEGLA